MKEYKLCTMGSYALHYICHLGFWSERSLVWRNVLSRCVESSLFPALTESAYSKTRVWPRCILTRIQCSLLARNLALFAKYIYGIFRNRDIEKLRWNWRKHGEIRDFAPENLSARFLHVFTFLQFSSI